MGYCCQHARGLILDSNFYFHSRRKINGHYTGELTGNEGQKFRTVFSGLLRCKARARKRQYANTQWMGRLTVV